MLDNNKEEVKEETKEDSKNESDSDFELNSGVEFDGNCLEPMLDFWVDDIEVSSWDYIIAELFDQSAGTFSFKYKPVKILGFG